MYVYNCAYVWLYVTCVWVPKEGVRECQIWDMCWELRSRLSEDQQTHLTTEPSSQPRMGICRMRDQCGVGKGIRVGGWGDCFFFRHCVLLSLLRSCHEYGPPSQTEVIIEVKWWQTCRGTTTAFDPFMSLVIDECGGVATRGQRNNISMVVIRESNSIVHEALERV